MTVAGIIDLHSTILDSDQNSFECIATNKEIYIPLF